MGALSIYLSHFLCLSYENKFLEKTVNLLTQQQIPSNHKERTMFKRLLRLSKIYPAYNLLRRRESRLRGLEGIFFSFVGLFIQFQKAGLFSP